VEPLFNFMDSSSMLTWLDLRTMVFDVGLHYKMRIDIYQAIFIVFIILESSFCILNFYGYLDLVDLHLEADFWVAIVGNLCMMTYLVANILIPNSHINENTEEQIVKLLEI